MGAKTTGRIKIPTNAGEKIELAEKVYNKHLEDGKSSKLLALEDHNWAVTGPTVAIAKSHHQQAEAFSKKAEELYKSRDLLLQEINGSLTASAKVLKGIYSKNPKKLGDYGFVVDDSKQAPKVKIQK